MSSLSVVGREVKEKKNVGLEDSFKNTYKETQTHVLKEISNIDSHSNNSESQLYLKRYATPFNKSQTKIY